MKKVRIKKCAYGGQSNHALDIRTEASKPIPGSTEMNTDYDDVRNTIQEVPREEANIEAERGETVITPDLDHFKIGGKRHSQGGTPIAVPGGSFVFSDTQKMKIGGPVLANFGKPEDTKKKFTPADLAKQYELNKFKAALDDPKTDSIQKRTSEMMIENNSKKLAQLALIQEGKKGFPNGIPQIAQSYVSEIMGEQQAPSFDQMMKNGGSVKAANGIQTPWNYNPEFGTFTPPNPVELDANGELKTAVVSASRITPSSSTNLMGIPALPQQQTPFVNNTEVNTHESPVNYGWTTPDKLDMLATMMNAASVKKYTPWQPAVQMTTPDVQYYNPERAISAVSEQSNAAMLANSIFSGPNARFQNSAIQGKAAEQVANITGQYAERNVGLANQSNQMNAEIANKQSMYNAERSKNLYDGNVIANQQFDNSMNQARSSIAQQFGQGWNNASTMYNMNKTTSPYYAVDPGTGKIKFHSPAAFSAFTRDRQASGDSTGELSKLYDFYYGQMKDKYSSNAKAREAAMEAAKTHYQKVNLYRQTSINKTGVGQVKTSRVLDDND